MIRMNSRWLFPLGDVLCPFIVDRSLGVWILLIMFVVVDLVHFTNKIFFIDRTLKGFFMCSNKRGKIEYRGKCIN